MKTKNNVALIGMPTAGKTVLGQKLAIDLAMQWVDTDQLIAKKQPNLIAEKGEQAFLKIEEQIILDLKTSNYVISTGGSAVYSPKSMAYLQSISLIVYINVPITVLKNRMEDYIARGVIGAKEKSLEELYFERTPLYEKYANLVINCMTDDLDVQYVSLLNALRHVSALK